MVMILLMMKGGRKEVFFYDSFIYSKKRKTKSAKTKVIEKIIKKLFSEIR